MAGGTERAVANVANLLHSKKHRVVILILDSTAHSFYPLHSQIQIIQKNLDFGLNKKGNVLTRKTALLIHIYLLRKVLNGLNAASIITTDYLFSIVVRLALPTSKKKVYSWEHHHFNHLEKSRFWQALYKKIYPKLDCVICLNTTEQKLFETIGCKTVVIPNFLVHQPEQKPLLRHKILLTIGWLSKIKGVDKIPIIAEAIFKKHPDWKWIIIGKGDEKDNLLNEIKKRNLASNVQVIEPVSPDLSSYYLTAAVYVLPSFFECFPMVLLEAMSYRLPAIAFNCPTGPKHIINNNEDGLLIEPENTERLTAALLQLMNDEEQRKKMGIQAQKNIRRFSADIVYAEWKKLIDAN